MKPKNTKKTKPKLPQIALVLMLDPAKLEKELATRRRSGRGKKSRSPTP